MRQLDFGQQLKVGSFSVSLTFTECLKIFNCFLVQIEISLIPYQ